jgi:uncharacterized membrane protein YdbT with pleckstrin-like domain
VRSYLEPDEAVRLKTRPHGAALVRPFARSTFLAAIGVGLVAAGMSVAWPLIALGTLALALAAWGAFRAVLAWDRTTLVVTSRKLLVVHGVVRRRAASAALPPGGAVEIDQSLPGRILGYGTIVAGDLEVPFVPQPARLWH